MVNTTYKKYVHAINFFARKSADNAVNRMKLMKLLWLSDRLHLMTNGRLTTDVEYVAMQFGPVPSQIMDITHNTGSEYVCDVLEASGNFVHSKAEFDATLFEKSEILAYTKIWNEFGEYDQFKLKDLSHQYPEWLRYEHVFTTRSTSIPMVMADFLEIPSTDNEMAKSSFFQFEKEKAEYMKAKKENAEALQVAIRNAHRAGRERAKVREN